MTNTPKSPRLTTVHVSRRAARILEGLGEVATSRWLSIDDAAKKLGVHPNTVRRALVRKELKHCRIGRRVLVQLPSFNP